MADGMLENPTAGWVRHTAGSAHHLRGQAKSGRSVRRIVPRTVAAIRDYLPRGNTLDPETFRRRHLLLCWVLALHIPALYAFGVWQGYGVGHVALEMATPAACLLLARVARNPRLAAFFLTAGLVFCSSVLVHLSGGTIEAHFHFFVLIGLIALYQDWVPFIWNVVFTVLSHGLGSVMDSTSMYNHYAAQNNPWLWAVIHGVAVLAACAGLMVFWKNTEMEQQRNSALATELATAELATAQTEAMQRRLVSQLLLNLARRNQSLLDRQLGLIADLERREVEPDALAELFQLDHVATRIRRNAESLLVLSGDEPPRRWGQPVPLAEVVRAAAAEVEDFRRVEVLVNEHLEVAGRAVADLAHLLAELIENATMFSPPTSEVRVRSHLTPTESPTYVVSVEDTGIGMTEADRRTANKMLAQPSDTDLLGSRLGFHVVSRLAARYGLQVRLAETPGGGVTALVTLPYGLVSVGDRHQPAVTAGVARLGGGFRSPPLAPSPQVPAPVGPPPPMSPVALPSLPAWAGAPEEARAASAVLTAPQTNDLASPGLRVTGRSMAPPSPPTLNPPGPVVERQPPADAGREAEFGPEPAPDGDERTGGLPRRVPGEALAATREKVSDTPEAGDSDTPDPDATAAATPTAPSTVSPDGDGARARVSAMLSRFQSGQRAGRAGSETSAAPPPEPPANRDEP
jgi:signal transduction histidine kinase